MAEKLRIGNIEIGKPRQLIYNILKYKNSGTVLDLGAGFGRHSLFLAHKGFQVTAVEIEQSRLEKLGKSAQKLGVDIRTMQADVADFVPKESYDVVLSTMVLHFLPAKEVKRAIAVMQGCTNKGGLNVVSAYTRDNPDGLRPHLFERNELRNAYDGWEILEYEESLGPELENSADGGPSRRYGARLIARRR